MSSIVKVDTIQENTSANGITVDGLNIKDSKLVTSNSVVAANITADAIDATKIADNAISEEHLDVTSITGHTAETSIADGDTILIHDASASALRKMTKANFVSGIGGANTPFCYGQKASAAVVSRGTMTKVTGMTHLEVDTASAFDGTTFTVPSNQGGKYQIIAALTGDYADVGQDGEELAVAIRINNSEKTLATIRTSSSVTGTGRTITTVANMIATLSATDYVEMFAHIQDSSGGDAKIAAGLTSLTVFKLIE